MVERKGPDRSGCLRVQRMFRALTTEGRPRDGEYGRQPKEGIFVVATPGTPTDLQTMIHTLTVVVAAGLRIWISAVAARVSRHVYSQT